MTSANVRAANAINVTMVTLLGLLALAFAVWAFSHEFSPVSTIYRSLSGEQQRHVSVFGWSLFMLVFGMRLASGAVRDLLKRLRTVG